MTIPLQNSVVYGPLLSRRLGRSLGINVLPTGVKFCLSNCIYCQYGWTDLKKMRTTKLEPASQLLEEMAREFEARCGRQERIDSITFSGNGEPTLHPELGALVQGVKDLRGRYFPEAKVTILSDSTRVHFPEVQRALAEFDEKYMKLDAGDRQTYLAVNNPVVNYVNFDFNLILEGLRQIPDVTLQSLFITAPVDNTKGTPLDAWLDAVVSIHPKDIHLYTVNRPTADTRVKPAAWNRLLEIKRLVRGRVDLNTRVIEGSLVTP